MTCVTFVLGHLRKKIPSKLTDWHILERNLCNAQNVINGSGREINLENMCTSKSGSGSRVERESRSMLNLPNFVPIHARLYRCSHSITMEAFTPTQYKTSKIHRIEHTQAVLDSEFRRPQTCSNLFTLGHPHQFWHLVAIVIGASGWYAS